ncbi:putative damage-inducible protein DinB [Alicyclobacillus cycloheptanicus]|uniref:Damage-inducible protein DinB n=1 Tax=Alicyclobacillus cycloheptanicus TaxID=1457 RepID=A0ABT9XJ84_9BACL|nr:putative damage-inducible protein DinB [Alicyclobacillus cycloheptanicus]
MATVKEITQELSRLHDALVEEAQKVKPEALHFHPAEDAWSVAQIMAHVAEFEHFFSTDVLRVKANPGTRFGRTIEHAERLQAVALTGTETWEALLEGLSRSKEEMLRNLNQLTDADLSIEGTNPKFGTQTIEWEIGHFLTEHLEKHAGQIRRTYQAYLDQQQ